MAMNISNIPPNAVEILFVEDLMQWLLSRQVGIYHTSDKIESYRDFVFSVFNDDVRKTVNFFDMSLEDEVEGNFSAFEELTEMSFIEYAFRCEEIHFKNGFLADDFLKYCVRLVSMAINFAVFNVPEALNIAFHNILKLLEESGLFTGGWDTVLKVARRYAKIYEDLHNVVTPDGSEDEFLADSSEDISLADRTEDLSPAGSSANNLDVNKVIPACDYVSNRDTLQNTRTDTDILSSAKERLDSGDPKPTTNSDFNTGQTL